jgi:hypothetical protein
MRAPPFTCCLFQMIFFFLHRASMFIGCWAQNSESSTSWLGFAKMTQVLVLPVSSGIAVAIPNYRHMDDLRHQRCQMTVSIVTGTYILTPDIALCMNAGCWVGGHIIDVVDKLKHTPWYTNTHAMPRFKYRAICTFAMYQSGLQTVSSRFASRSRSLRLS